MFGFFLLCFVIGELYQTALAGIEDRTRFCHSAHSHFEITKVLPEVAHVYAI